LSQKGVFARLLVGYDGSENSERALSRAIELAQQSRGELRIVVVADTMSYAAYASGGGMYKRFNQQTKANAQNLSMAALDTAKAAGLKNVYASDEEGQPADMIRLLLPSTRRTWWWWAAEG